MNLTRPPASRPDPLSQLLQSAATAWKRGHYSHGIELLQRAADLAPQEPGIQFDLGRCHGLRHDYEAAGRCFEKAIRISGWKTASFLEAGRRSLDFFQHKMAGQYLERALKKEDSVEVLTELSGIYLHCNRIAEATDLAERALHKDGDAAVAKVTRARLHRLAGDLSGAENLLRSAVSRTDATVWTRAHAWYELGATLDLQQRYDDAMAAFIEAKALVKPMSGANIAIQDNRMAELKKLEEILSSDLLQPWHENGKALEPRRKIAFLCSHPRSGTTLLEQMLDSHPDIVSAEETRIFYDEAFLPLCRDRGQTIPVPSLPLLDAVSAGQLSQSRHDYFRTIDLSLNQSVGTRLLVDKNPSLTALIPAMIRIFPEMKLLMAIRDPRDVCLSCFMLPLMPAVSTINVFLTLEATAAEYASVMGFWQKLKPLMPGPHLEVRYEDVVEDLESVARRTLEFLDVPWNDRVLEFQKHGQNKLVRSPTYADVRKPVTKRAVGRWRNYQKYLEPSLPALEPFVKAFGYE